MDVILFRTFSHVIIMTQKVDPHSEGGARILIKESSIKAIDMYRDLINELSGLVRISTNSTTLLFSYFLIVLVAVLQFSCHTFD